MLPEPGTQAVAAASNGSGGMVQSVPTPSRNLYQRLAAVRLALGGTIPKGGTAPQVMGGYKFIDWDNVADRIGTLLAEHGVLVIPEMPEADIVHIGNTRNGNPIYRSTVSMEFEIINIDNPSDRIVKKWKGQGDDGGDKAIQKGCTSSEKYFLLKLFLLGGADDTEANGEETKVDRPATTTSRTRTDTAGRQQPANDSKPHAHKPRVIATTPTGRGCPECGTGTLDHIQWDNGGQRIACTNWRECKYREPVPAGAQP